MFALLNSPLVNDTMNSKVMFDRGYFLFYFYSTLRKRKKKMYLSFYWIKLNFVSLKMNEFVQKMLKYQEKKLSRF